MSVVCPSRTGIASTLITVGLWGFNFPVVHLFSDQISFPRSEESKTVVDRNGPKHNFCQLNRFISEKAHHRYIATMENEYTKPHRPTSCRWVPFSMNPIYSLNLEVVV